MREIRKPKQRREIPKKEAQPVQKEPCRPEQPCNQNHCRAESKNR